MCLLYNMKNAFYVWQETKNWWSNSIKISSVFEKWVDLQTSVADSGIVDEQTGLFHILKAEPIYDENSRVDPFPPEHIIQIPSASDIFRNQSLQNASWNI